MIEIFESINSMNSMNKLDTTISIDRTEMIEYSIWQKQCLANASMYFSNEIMFVYFDRSLVWKHDDLWETFFH